MEVNLNCCLAFIVGSDELADEDNERVEDEYAEKKLFDEKNLRKNLSRGR